MNNIEKIIEYIKTECEAECREIAHAAAEACERIRAEYSKTEQDEYWKAINTGTKETEQRLKQLAELAAQEASKQIISLHQDMADKAIELATEKLKAIPDNEFASLLKAKGIDPKCTPEELIEMYREKLMPIALSALFD